MKYEKVSFESNAKFGMTEKFRESSELNGNNAFNENPNLERHFNEIGRSHLLKNPLRLI